MHALKSCVLLKTIEWLLFKYLFLKLHIVNYNVLLTHKMNYLLRCFKLLTGSSFLFRFCAELFLLFYWRFHFLLDWFPVHVINFLHFTTSNCQKHTFPTSNLFGTYVQPQISSLKSFLRQKKSAEIPTHYLIIHNLHFHMSQSLHFHIAIFYNDHTSNTNNYTTITNRLTRSTRLRVM